MKRNRQRLLVLALLLAAGCASAFKSLPDRHRERQSPHFFSTRVENRERADNDDAKYDWVY